MKVLAIKPALRLPLLVFAAVATTRCISPESPLIEAGGECASFTPGQSAGNDVEIDAKVHVFMEASADFTKLAEQAKGDVKTACANIAADLGATDTWTALGNKDESIANQEGTGACNAAATKIQEIMRDDRTTDFALTVTRGECHCDFQAQQECDAGCDTSHACTPESVETRCDPGQLSVMCEQNCMAQAFCEGTAEHSCNCVGSCESTCMGQCDGSCIAPDGNITQNDPNCHGKCTSSCHGACEGACQIEEQQGINCGTNVRCRGGCMSSFTDPICESVIHPANCTDNVSCHESCSARIAANPVCEPTKVQLFASASAGPDVQKLVSTINNNLPPLVAFAEAKGPIILDAVKKLAVTAKVVVDEAGDLNGKSLSCAKAASKSASDSGNTLQVISDASAMVSTSVSSRAQ